MKVKAYKPSREMYDRVKKMLLLGFNNIEMVESLELALKTTVTLSDVDDCVDYIHAQWDTLPEAKQVRISESELWDRSEMFKNDMLNLYQRMLVNALAKFEGKFTHLNGDPVVDVKPAEVSAIMDKILKIEREVAQDKREALRLQGSGTSLDTPLANRQFELNDSDELDESDIIPPTRTEL